ncbi:hypothetical protein, partial [Luteibacter rhizovicinus]|uniref:hypothetical protein n=1 Tax=Luteibacter rhizovicinus TaxID=242606 RepID=UPI001B8069D1
MEPPLGDRETDAPELERFEYFPAHGAGSSSSHRRRKPVPPAIPEDHPMLDWPEYRNELGARIGEIAK